MAFALAGSRNICEVHGNAYSFICRACGRLFFRERRDWDSFINRLKFAVGKRITKLILDFAGKCPDCKKRLESAIVLFGQPLPEKELERSHDMIKEAKALLCVGTSGVVYPVAAFPYEAKERGAVVININLAATPLDQISDYALRADAGDCLQKISLHL